MKKSNYPLLFARSFPFNNKWTFILFLLVIGVIAIIGASISSRPYVVSSTPFNGATNVSVNITSIAANNLAVPEVAGVKGGVDNNSISNNTVKLFKVVGNTEIEILGIVQGTGGGDAISFSPSYALEPHTTYKFIITEGVKSFNGAKFLPYKATFTTGEAKPDAAQSLRVKFEKIPVPGTQGKKYTSLTFGPDNKLYALRLDGVIERFSVTQNDGTLYNQQVLPILLNKYGPRSAIGLAFDLRSTPDNLIAWVSHCSSGLGLSPEFDGNISRLSGPNLSQEQLMVTKLPRSNKDHLVNSIVFGPDSALYFSQGSNSSMGDYDSFWQRRESLLSAAVLRLDIEKLKGIPLPLDVRTTTDQKVINQAPRISFRMTDGTYNPYGLQSPLTIYASGVRNAYDLVWHSNSQLYVPTNGSAAGGNTPPSVKGTRRTDGSFYNGPEVPATSRILLQNRWAFLKNLVNVILPTRLLFSPPKSGVQNDWLCRINPLKPVGYFGHPNPFRGEYVANRGYTDNPKYPVNLGPDVNYREAAFNFGLNKSPNGIIEYKSNTFNGALKGKILVCRFSGGGDIMILEPGSMVKDPKITNAAQEDKIYDITRVSAGSSSNGLIGMSGFANPLDLVEDVRTGNLYVIEFNRQNSNTKKAQITLLRANPNDLASAQPFESKVN
ncbi:MAG: Ig-like domain-containing protein [Bacteroidota bacterium]|nr:Ig-like domain-containing protein [Bacteroidota bacterium]